MNEKGFALLKREAFLVISKELYALLILSGSALPSAGSLRHLRGFAVTIPTWHLRGFAVIVHVRRLGHLSVLTIHSGPLRLLFTISTPTWHLRGFAVTIRSRPLWNFTIAAHVRCLGGLAIIIPATGSFKTPEACVSAAVA
jgi:hypothetical protein